MPNNIVMTRHGTARVKDRVGGKKSKAQDNASRAFAYGLTHAETKASLKRYLDKLYLSHGTANNLRVYHHNVYVFRGTTLITVLPLPHNLCKTADKLQQGKIMISENSVATAPVISVESV